MRDIGSTKQSKTASAAEDHGLQARYERYREILRNFTIMSDVFMRNVLKKKACTEYILQVIMEKDLRVVEQELQKDYKNLQGRSAILDCVVMDAEGKRYDVEIQQDNEGASPKRARYYSGLMDMNTLEAGQDFDELPETYVIFITREDIIGYGLPAYHIGRTIGEIQVEFRDESHIIYVNSKIQEDTKLGRLMHDMNCKNADEMYSKILAERVRELKETERGEEMMCKEMDEIFHEGIEIGEKKAKRKMVLNLSGMGMDVEQIAKAVGEPEHLVKEWIDAPALTK